ncbi:MAG: hypothetical protein WC942_02440 [Clostridia bacterium]|jgi:hypothetical protein
MKIKGKKIVGPNREIIAIPRGDKEDIVFVAEAVLDQSEFDKLCPLPEPRKKKIDGQDVPDLRDPNYLKQVNLYSEKKIAWLVLTALTATEDLEWETVDLKDPGTWIHFRKELNASGFSDLEINMIVNGALSAQGLNEAKIEAARERFLRSKQAQLELLNSLKGGQNSMQSGVPANA